MKNGKGLNRYMPRKRKRGERMEVKVESHIAEVLSELEKKIELGLESVGEVAIGNAQEEITSMGAVDTGRLRNSIDKAIDGDTVYIGTNVKYAPYVEYGTKRHPQARPFLRNAAANYTDEYISVLKETLAKG